MQYSFTCSGHRNITSMHRNTFEFTKDNELSLEGDCIIGVGADFSPEGIKKFIDYKIKNAGNSDKIPIKITIKADGITETANGFVNTEFDDGHEIVIRKTGFVSGRTLVILADKSAKEIDRKLAVLLKDPATKIRVIFE